MPRTESWRACLAALARDVDAVRAAAAAYGRLDAAGRDDWLDALDEETLTPRLVLYAPLLPVETDPQRLARIHEGIAGGEENPAIEPRALSGFGPEGERVAVLVLPLYLSFVHVFACRFHPGRGFIWVRYEAFTHDDDAPAAGGLLDGWPLERTPLKVVVEELAHAVVAHRRAGGSLPEELGVLADLFSPGGGAHEAGG